jgi:hypothetical protein
MNTDTILEYMAGSGIKPEICEILTPILNDLAKTDRDPYMMGVDLVHTASCIITKALPPDEQFHFGKFLQKCGDRQIRAGMTKRVINTNGSNQNYIPKD